MSIKHHTMKHVIVLVASLVILLSVLSSGCTSGTAPAATPVPTLQTTEPVTIIPISTVPTLEPVRTLPPEQDVNLVLTKDRPSSEIHLLYQGGTGDGLVSSIWMDVHTSDGAVHEYVMSNAQRPLPGDEIVAPGDRGTDRCEVFVVSSGTRYKVIDGPALGGGYY